MINLYGDRKRIQARAQFIARPLLEFVEKSHNPPFVYSEVDPGFPVDGDVDLGGVPTYDFAKISK